MHITELESRMKQNSLDDGKHSYQLNASYSSVSYNDTEVSTIKNDDVASNFSYIMANNNDRGDSDIMSMQRKIRESTEQQESLLDEYCDTLVDQSSYFSDTPVTHTKIKKLEYNGAASGTTKYGYIHAKNAFANGGSSVSQQSSYQTDHYAESNGYGFRGGRGAARAGEIEKASIDEKKKTKLLAVLKKIDYSNSSSFEN